MSELANRDLSSTPFSWTTLVRIADTEFVPRGLRGKPEAILACIYLGREIGLGPMQSISMIDVIDGRPSLSAELMNARIRAEGHSIQIVDLSPTGATIRGKRADNGDEATFSFTAEHAERAGLLKGRNYTSYPEAMYLARATSALARFLFPDVFAATHAYAPEDLGGMDTPLEAREEMIEGLAQAVEELTADDVTDHLSEVLDAEVVSDDA